MPGASAKTAAAESKTKAKAKASSRSHEPFWDITHNGRSDVPERDHEGNAIVTLPTKAFVRCTDLIAVSLPPGLKAIGNFAFAGCSSLKSASLPAGLKAIGIGAFSGATKLSVMDLPSTVTVIGRNAFSKCGLVSVTMPTGVEQLDVGTFEHCTSLSSVQCLASSKLHAICDRAFAGCTALVAISLPDSVSYIGNRVFDGCYSLTNAGSKLPAGLANLGHSVFAHCPGVTAIGVPEGLESFNIRTLQPLLLPQPKASSGVRSRKKKGPKFRWSLGKEGMRVSEVPTGSASPSRARPGSAPASPKGRGATATTPGRPTSARGGASSPAPSPSPAQGRATARGGRAPSPTPEPERPATPSRLRFDKVKTEELLRRLAPTPKERDAADLGFSPPPARRPSPTIVVRPRPSVAYEECRAELRQLAKEKLHTQKSNIGMPHAFRGIF